MRFYIMEQMEAQMLIFCLDSKTINTLSNHRIKSIVGHTTSECVCGGGGGGGGGGGSRNNKKEDFYSNKAFLLDRPVSIISSEAK